MRLPDRLALLLPGQGSQFVGMGRDLALEFPPARRCYEQADELLGVPLSRISWEGPAEVLTRTENAQPAILLHTYAIWSLLPERLRERAVVAAGHSLGEFSAYLLAGAIEFGDALRLVRRRGELMSSAGEQTPGSMTAVIGLSAAAVEEACRAVEGIVVPANLNAPGQVVISGEVDAVERAVVEARARGAKRTIPLPVSGAFHSPLMSTAREALRRALEDIELQDPRFPVIANAVAEPVRDAERARDLLVAQLTSPVRWVECFAQMQRFEPDLWLEAGPGSVLTGLSRRVDRSLSARSVGDPAALEDFMESLSDVRA